MYLQTTLCDKCNYSEIENRLVKLHDPLLDNNAACGSYNHGRTSSMCIMNTFMRSSYTLHQLTAAVLNTYLGVVFATTIPT